MRTLLANRNNEKSGCCQTFRLRLDGDQVPEAFAAADNGIYDPPHFGGVGHTINTISGLDWNRRRLRCRNAGEIPGGFVFIL